MLPTREEAIRIFEWCSCHAHANKSREEEEEAVVSATL